MWTGVGPPEDFDEFGTVRRPVHYDTNELRRGGGAVVGCCRGEIVDRRYLYSWLTFFGVTGVAWLMSQMDGVSDRRPVASSWTETTVGAGVPASSSVERGGSISVDSSVAAAGGSAAIGSATGGADGGRGEPRLLSAGGALPTIPGLLDEDTYGDGVSPGDGVDRGPVQFDLAEMAGQPAAGPVVKSTAGVPLRPASAARQTEGATTGLTPLPADAPAIDGSTPPRRAVPTFSMPNAASLPKTSSPADLQPQFLPGDRHVLRPILRSGAPPTAANPVGGLVDGQVGVSERGSVGDLGLSVTSAGAISSSGSAWDAPMPGVKPGGATGATGALSSVGAWNAGGVGGLTEGSNAARSSAPPGSPAGAVGEETPLVHDPLFVQAEENLRSAAATGSWLGTPATGSALGPGGVGARQSVGLVRSDAGLERAKSRGGVRPRPSQGDYIWHEIQQNQTLESISLQYQGDTSLVGQLLELNRDVLADPQLLPIGRAIRVPIR